MGAIVVAGCSGPPPPEAFRIAVKVESDPTKPIANAVLSWANRPVGTTGADGRAILKVPGVEGEIVDITVTCPDGFQSPPRPLGVRLARFADKSKVPEYAVACVRPMRRVVVVVRAENGPNLPVVYLDRPVTRTDASGAASIALEVAPGAQFTVGLDTGDRMDIKPSHPSKRFNVSTRDDVFLFDQRFDVEKRPASRSLPAPTAHPL
jgi:hypothetical protein